MKVLRTLCDLLINREKAYDFTQVVVLTYVWDTDGKMLRSSVKKTEPMCINGMVQVGLRYQVYPLHEKLL